MEESFTYTEHDHLNKENQKNIKLSKTTIEHDHDHDHDDDLHYWVDPTNVIQMIDYIYEHVIIVDPDNQSYYYENMIEYKNKIETLHHEIEDFFLDDAYKNQTFYFAGHNAFSSFASRYHINIESIFSEFKPDDDLTSAEIISFANAIKSSQSHYLFIEALVDPKTPLAIKSHLQAEDDYPLTLLPLHSYHNLDQTDWNNQVTYYDLLVRNFNHLKQALGVSI